MTEQDQEIYQQILLSNDKEKTVTYFFGPFNYNLPWITTISSILIGYKYVYTNIYEPLYNQDNILIGYPAISATEEIIQL